MKSKNFGIKSAAFSIGICILTLIVDLYLISHSFTRLQHSQKTGFALIISNNAIVFLACRGTFIFLTIWMWRNYKCRYVWASIKNNTIGFHSLNPDLKPICLQLNEITEIDFNAERSKTEFRFYCGNTCQSIKVMILPIPLRGILDLLKTYEFPVNIIGPDAKNYLMSKTAFKWKMGVAWGLFLASLAFYAVKLCFRHKH